MRMHHANAKEKKKLSKKTKRAIIYSAVFGVSTVAIALIITLSLMFGKGPAIETETPPPDPGIDIEAPPPPPYVPVFVLPLEDFTVGKHAVLDKLVYNSSMNQWRTHNGMDFMAAEGTAVRTITDGTVLSVEHTQLEASVVTIQHADGVVSVYKGLSTDIKVEEGDTLTAGDAIGSVAANMPRERSEGAHLHLEVKQNGTLVDPMLFLPELGDK